MSRDDFIRANEILKKRSWEKGASVQIAPMGGSYQMIIHANDGTTAAGDLEKIRNEAEKRMADFLKLDRNR